MKKTIIRNMSFLLIISLILSMSESLWAYASSASSNAAASGNSGAEGQLITAGAASSMDKGIFDTGTASEDVVFANAGEASASNKSEIVDEQIDKTIAGYTNLGIASVENHLNIRVSANETSDLAGKMTKNAGCEILDVSGDWAHIKSGKVEGYVNLQYLLTGEAARKKAREVITLVAKVNTTTLFVREQPSTSADVITMVPIDEELEVTEGEIGDPWVKVQVDEDEGYVNTLYVDISEQLDKAVTLQELKYGEGVSDVRVSIVNYAKQFLGNPYVWGGTSLTKGCDCSGYVQAIFKKYGVYLPRTSAAQSNCGTKISASEAKPGDLFFYGKKGRVNHVAIYIGGGLVINASNPRSGIKISNAYYRTPLKVRRVLSE